MAWTSVAPHVFTNQRLRAPQIVAFRRLLLHAFIAALFVVGALFAHEVGHALVAQFFGARIVLFNVLGIQWYPRLEWMPQFGFGGYVYWFAPVNGDEFYRTNHRLIMMAGSNFTLLLAICAVSALNVRRVRGVWRTALAVISLYFLDGVIHALPAAVNLPLAWSSRFTRSFSEAYFAAVGLGIPGPVYVGALLALGILILIMLTRALRK